ncbi:MAG: hypothetical protein Ct9H300mP7_6130 [Verrucomicrobiota bacterium]|nr:MAG: hypothetical protein Ct9H300mP7_6130 [Verrucomicrobiota bacterium]
MKTEPKLVPPVLFTLGHSLKRMVAGNQRLKRRASPKVPPALAESRTKINPIKERDR